MIITALILTRTGGYELTKGCDVIDSLYSSQNATLAQYPACQSFYSGENPEQSVIVPVRMSSRPEEIAAALDVSFGMALWLAMIIHAVGVEIYVGAPLSEMTSDSQLTLHSCDAPLPRQRDCARSLCSDASKPACKRLRRPRARARASR